MDNVKDVLVKGSKVEKHNYYYNGSSSLIREDVNLEGTNTNNDLI